MRRVIVGVFLGNDLRDYRTGEPRAAEPLHVVRGFLNAHLATYRAVGATLRQHAFLKDGATRIGLLRPEFDYEGAREFSEAVLASSVAEVMKLGSGLRLIVLVIPDRGLWLGGNQATERRIHERFVSLLREKGLDVIDMARLFEATGRPLAFHFAEGHWNARGHACAALAIAAYLDGRRELVASCEVQ